MRFNLIGAYRLFDVLDCLLTEVGEAQRQDLSYLIIGYTGDTESSGPRERLQSSSDVHPVTEQITGAHHHVADMYANAEVDLTVLRKT